MKVAIFLTTILLMQLTFAAELYSHAELQINEGTYGDLNSDLREWFESKKETIQQYSKHVTLKEMPGKEMQAPKLVFFNMEGNV